MRAAQINSYGGQEAVEFTEEAPKPAPSNGEVLIEVKAAAVNPFDWKVRDGLMQSMGELKFPATLGGDFAGVVAELGEGARGLEVGQEVYGQAGALSGQGSFADFTPVSADSVAPKPIDVDFITAAAVPLTGVSAYQALVDHANLQNEQKILIHGGGGGIGTVAIQLAKHLGATVVTTAAPKDIEYVKGLGADEAIDFTSQDFIQLVKDCDVVYDLVGGDVTDKSYQVLKPGGILVAMVGKPNEELEKKYDVKFIGQSTKVTRERLEKVGELVSDGTIQIHVDKTYSLEAAPEALEYLKQNHPQGKVVLEIA